MDNETPVQTQADAGLDPTVPVPQEVEYDEKGNLTRKGMEAVINSGGSVHAGGMIYQTIDSLPSAAELAKGDARKEAEVSNSLKAQIAVLNKQLAILQTPPAETEEDTDADEAAKAKSDAKAKLQAEAEAAKASKEAKAAGGH